MGQQQPLSPNQLAVSPDNKLTAVYQVPHELLGPGREQQLTDWVMDALNWAIYGFTTGQFNASAQGRTFAGPKVAFVHPEPLPEHLQKLFSQSPVDTQGMSLEFVWEATGTPAQGNGGAQGAGNEQGLELAMVEDVFDQILTELNNSTRQGLLMWVSAIGSFRKAGLLVLDKDTQDQFPYQGQIPVELDQAADMHQKLSYQKTGSAWKSITVLWTPGGELVVEPDYDDVHEWVKPVPDTAWAEFQSMFPSK